MKPQPFPKPLIIGICGLKQSGKNTVASILHSMISLKEYPHVFTQGFADALKSEVAAILGTTVKHLEANKKSPLVRHLFQWYGTEYARRERGEDCWVKVMDELVTRHNVKSTNYCLLIPDLRFLNEAAWIRSKGGLILKVERQGQVAGTDQHQSETELVRIKPDFYVSNDGQTIGRLTWEVKNIKQFIWERYSNEPRPTDGSRKTT